jgi:site-specific recombinase XerD
VHRFLSRRDTRGLHLFDVTTPQVVAHLSEMGKHGASRRQSRVALASLFGYLHQRGYRADDPTEVLAGYHEPRVRPKPTPFTPEELARLWKAAARRDPRRAWAIQAIYGIGARRTEFAMLRADDIDFENRRVLLRVTKRNKPRSVDMGPLAEAALRELIRLGPTPRGTVPGTILGVGPTSLGKWMKEAAMEAGFPPGRKQHTHTLRATFATHLDHAGVPAAVIRDLMGHVSIETTDFYLGSYDRDGAQAVGALPRAWRVHREETDDEETES